MYIFGVFFPSTHMLMIVIVHIKAYGRRYGLVGRNGVGKTTFLKHFVSWSLLLYLYIFFVGFVFLKT